MTIDSSFLGLDATAWTALATIVALLLGLWSIFGAPIVSFVRRPSLSLDWHKCFMHSERVEDAYWVRVPVMNRWWVKAAANVEVFLEAVEELHSNHPLVLPRYLPIRIRWTHGSASICDRIAPGSYRLLDLATLAFAINSETAFVDTVMIRLSHENPVHLRFNCEIQPVQGHIALPVGTFRLKFLVTSDVSVQRQSATVTNSA